MVDISQKVITIIFPAEEELFFTSRKAKPAMRPTLPPIEWESGFYQEAERPVHEATHFIWFQVKNEQSYIRPSTPVCLHVLKRSIYVYFAYF